MNNNPGTSFQESMRQLVPLALIALKHVMSKPDAAPEARVAAARLVLEIASRDEQFDHRPRLPPVPPITMPRPA
jgi:hypothetical protein